MIAELRITRLDPHDTGTHAHHFKAYFFQCPSHHAVQFIAPAATSLPDDLVVARLQIQDDRTTQQYVEIFKRDRVLMSSMYGLKRCKIRPHTAVEPNALQIGRKFQANTS